MAFTKASVAELKERINIVDVVGRAVPLKKAGSNYKGVCPFHKEKTPSFSVSEQRQSFHCFGCGVGGDAIGFVQKFYNLDFNEAVERLAGEYGVTLEKTRSSGEDLNIYYEINQAAAKFFYRSFTEKANKGYTYMKKRGIRPDILKKFGVGYADAEWDSLYRHLTGLGYEQEKLIELGLVSEKNGKCYDKFRNRVIFPIINVRGKVIGFGGRAIDPNDNPKYLNSPESRIFLKKDNLYGLNFAKGPAAKEGFIILVEGYMDTIGVYQGGIENVAASLGTALTENQAKLIKRYTENVVLSYDADNAGRAAAMRGMDILKAADCKVRVMHVTDGKDPDEFIRKEGREAFRKLLDQAMPFGAYKIEAIKRDYDLTDNEQKIACLKKIAGMLRQLTPVEQDVYIKEAAKQLQVAESALAMEMRRVKEAEKPPVREPAPPEAETPGKERLKITRLEADVLRLVTLNEAFIQRIEEAGLLKSPAARKIFAALQEDVQANASLDLTRAASPLAGWAR
ncbi:MAG: DNA primase [Firmicutes bacterium]|nr:DNA primase [Bacillota bacterium]